VKRDGISRLVVLPLYPQFSVSTSGSSLRLLERLLKQDPALSRVRCLRCTTGLAAWSLPPFSHRPQRTGQPRALAGTGRCSCNLSSRPEAAFQGQRLACQCLPARLQQVFLLLFVQVKHVVIPSWYQRPGYVRAMADLIWAELRSGAFPADQLSDVHIFFSAHGVPVSYIEEGEACGRVGWRGSRRFAAAVRRWGSASPRRRWSGHGKGRARPPCWHWRASNLCLSAAIVEQCLGVQHFAAPGSPRRLLLSHLSCLLPAAATPPGDPYKEEMEECVELVMAELRRRGVANAHTLAYQSRVGPVQWLQPYTDDSIRWAMVGLLDWGRLEAALLWLAG
jgi:hypothetical protein